MSSKTKKAHPWNPTWTLAIPSTPSNLFSFIFIGIGSYEKVDVLWWRTWWRTGMHVNALIFVLNAHPCCFQIKFSQLEMSSFFFLCLWGIFDSAASFVISAWKSGPVQSFAYFWKDQDQDWSINIPEPQKTRLDRLRLVFFGLDQSFKYFCINRKF